MASPSSETKTNIVPLIPPPSPPDQRNADAAVPSRDAAAPEAPEAAEAAANDTKPHPTILLPAASDSAASYPADGATGESSGNEARQARSEESADIKAEEKKEQKVETEKPKPTPEVEALNILLRGEMAAIETYHQGIEKAGDEAGEELRALQRDHRDAAGALWQHIQQHGGEPAKGAGAWGAFAKAMEGTAKLFGNVTALGVLKEGEQHGTGLYNDTLAKPALGTDCQELVRGLMAKQQQHVAVLERLIAQSETVQTG
jgi:uncharacterized protein DUF2383